MSGDSSPAGTGITTGQASGSVAREQRPEWVWILVAWSAVALLLASSYYASGLAAGREEPLGRALGLGFLEAYSWIPITIAVFALVRRFPLEHGRRLRNGAVLLGAGVVLIAGKVAFFHYTGRSFGLLRPEFSLLWALVTFAGHRLLTYCLLVGLAHSVEYHRRIRERELVRSRLEGKLTEAQLQMLKMQLQPHFLFNTLHAISTLVHSDPDRADHMIASLSDMLRTSLALQQTQEVTVRDELAALAPYLEIEKTRLGERLTVDLSVSPDTLDARLPHLVLQPLVENAIRHGISPRRRNGRVEIVAARANGSLRLQVRDDGGGFTGYPRPGAVGLANTRARLQQLYGGEHRFRIETVRGQGTCIEITIPFRPAANGGNGSSPPL